MNVIMRSAGLAGLLSQPASLCMTFLLKILRFSNGVKRSPSCCHRHYPQVAVGFTTVRQHLPDCLVLLDPAAGPFMDGFCKVIEQTKQRLSSMDNQSKQILKSAVSSELQLVVAHLDSVISGPAKTI